MLCQLRSLVIAVEIGVDLPHPLAVWGGLGLTRLDLFLSPCRKFPPTGVLVMTRLKELSVTVHESKASALPRLARMCSDCLPGLERLEFLVVPAKRKAYNHIRSAALSVSAADLEYLCRKATHFRLGDALIVGRC